MRPDFLQLLSLTEQHLQVLRELITELATARPALTSMDLDGIYSHVARQTLLCRRLNEARMQAMAGWKEASAPLACPPEPRQVISRIHSHDAVAGDRLTELLDAISIAEAELRQQNRIHTLLIDGTRRTLAILGNALATLSPTYGPPSPAAPSSATGVLP